jgi:hypothetical protein
MHQPVYFSTRIGTALAFQPLGAYLGVVDVTPWA